MPVEEIELSVPVPMIPVPETRTFGFTTRLVDFGAPQVEPIIRPATTLPNQTPRVRLFSGETRTHVEVRGHHGGTMERLKYGIKRRLHARVAPAELPADVLGLDVRRHFLGNHAHLVHLVLAPLRYLEHALETEPNASPRPIHVIVGENPPALATRFLESAGVPWIETDGQVRGDLIEMEGHHAIALIPFLERQPWQGASERTPKRVYVSRRGDYRGILNEDAVLGLLEAEGFTRVYMEDYPLPLQWAMLVEAEEIVGIHGAGLAGIGFAAAVPERRDARARVIELYSAGFSSSCFRDYSAAVGSHWVGVRGRVTSEIVRDLDERGDIRAHDGASFEVDLEALRMALEYSRAQGSQGGVSPAPA